MSQADSTRRGSPVATSETARAAAPVEGIVLGRLVAINGLGVPSVEYPGSPGGAPREARTVVCLDEKQVGRTLALAFEGGRVDAPIVLGVVHDPLSDLMEVDAREGESREAVVDGERVVFDAQREIVLRCGEASIRLQRDGKILISGTHLLSRSKGPNRVKGASVQIN